MPNVGFINFIKIYMLASCVVSLCSWFICLLCLYVIHSLWKLARTLESVDWVKQRLGRREG